MWLFEWGVTPPVTFNDEELTQVVWEASQGLAEVIQRILLTAGKTLPFTKSEFLESLPLSVQTESRMRQIFIMIT